MNQIANLIDQAIECAENYENPILIDAIQFLNADLEKAKNGTLTSQNFNFPNGDIAFPTAEDDTTEFEELESRLEHIDSLLH